MNWTYISVSQYQNLLFNMQALRTSALVLALACFVVSMFLSIWLTHHAYNPIRHLLEKMSTIPKMKENRRQINEFAILDTTYAEMTEKMKSMESEASVARQAHVRGAEGGDETAFRRLARDGKAPISWRPSFCSTADGSPGARRGCSPIPARPPPGRLSECWSRRERAWQRWGWDHCDHSPHEAEPASAPCIGHAGGGAGRDAPHAPRVRHRRHRNGAQTYELRESFDCAQSCFQRRFRGKRQDIP